MTSPLPAPVPSAGTAPTAAEVPPTFRERYESSPAIRHALTRYRVLATVVGVSLVLIIFIGVPIQIAGHDGFEKVVATVHGWVFFPLYLIASFDLSRRVHWSFAATLSVLLAGVVPVGSFYVEHRVRTNVDRLLELRTTQAGPRREP